MDFEQQALLPALNKNIVCGNSLIGRDIVVADFFENGDSERKLNPMNFEDAFPQIMIGGGFDAIVGNPPYIFTRNEGLTTNEKLYFYKNYHYQSAQLNTFGLFLEKSQRICRKGAALGYITPNNWLTIDSFAGSKPAAEQRQSVYYLGGDRDLAEELDPLLSLVSSARLYIGTTAQAASLKLAMNLNLAAQMEGLAEALTLARRSGVADETFFQALSRNAGNSGLVKLKEAKLRSGDFSAQFSVKHMLKDMRLASGMAASEGLPALRGVSGRLAEAAQAGHADEDFSALIRLL